jgi:hypothetical protein
MSWRSAAELARRHADDSRRKADEQRADPPRVEDFNFEDRPALVAWLHRRIAQEFDKFSNECQRRSSVEDVTVIERGPKRG